MRGDTGTHSRARPPLPPGVNAGMFLGALPLLTDSAPPAVVPWGAGTRVDRYQIESQLAAGGMAEVWLAKIKGAAGFDKRVVIKTMLAHLQHRPELARMFITEASVGAQLAHPNVVQVFDFGRSEGRYFIVMEYVPGLTLRQAHKRSLARGGRLPLHTVLHVMADVCEALHHVHELGDARGPLGLVHRDLSPDNVMVSDGGGAKLIDFGASRATARMPPSPVFVGKYRYAAPERIRSLREDRRSDIFSAGVVLYEVLTGARPFDGADADVMNAIVTSIARDPRERVPELPAEVAAIVRQAMATDPAERYPTARDMSTELLQVLHTLGATHKTRELTSCLAALMRPVDCAAPTAVPLDPSAPVSLAVAPDEASAGGSDGGEIYEVEIFEPSGPARGGNCARGELRSPHEPPKEPAEVSRAGEARAPVNKPAP